MSNTRSIYRTHHCNELCSNDIGKVVKISGWLHSKRDHGGVLFLDIRDHYGITQVVTSLQEEQLKQLSAEEYHHLQGLSLESVVTIDGVVLARPNATVNKTIATGEVEILVTAYTVQSEAAPLPFPVNSEQPLPEELRLTYRFLDLRRTKMHQHIMLRTSVIDYIRDKMRSLGFNEFQTPILTSSSPEGARDFLVPSRLHPGKFYALPQAPQQFKQLLMIAGFDRYFQIAPCFRDEDARADRAPGCFYQLDIEMSFVTQDDVFAMVEEVMTGIFSTFGDNRYAPAAPFQRITYREAMLKYGSDKPDLRNPLVIVDATSVFANSDFTVFRKAIATGAVVRAISVRNVADKPRSFFDNMGEFARKELGLAGLAYVIWEGDGAAKGPIAKFIQQEHAAYLNCAAGDGVFFICDTEEVASKAAGRIRQKLGEELGLIQTDAFKFCWIVDFPLYEWEAESKKVNFSHNPFSMPQGGLDALLQADTVEKQLALLAYQYDLVCNGIELSSGAIRNHQPEIMYRAFEIAGYSRAEVDEKFGAMISAFRYGAPPHGGIAPGVDRIVMLLADVPNIREIVAFPLNQSGQDLLMNAPSSVSQQQLKELSIKLC